MLKNFLSLFLDSNCPICERSADRILCKYCFNNLQSCQFNRCNQIRDNDLSVFVWGRYGSYLKRAIASFKNDLHQEIGTVLGELLALAWLNSSLGLAGDQLKLPLRDRQEEIVVMPIPLHQTKQEERGFNQCDIIAKRFCQITKYNLQYKLLKRVRNTNALFSLNLEERQKEINQAFQLGEDFTKLKSNSSVLILDDIYTTGTTVKEACKILRQNQIKIKGIIAVSSTSLKFS